MRSAIGTAVSILCLVLSCANVPVQAGDGVLSAIPSDALGFAAVHDLAAASQSIDDVAGLVGAPAPSLLPMAKMMTGLKAGLDEHGTLALVLTSVDPRRGRVALVPVTDFAAFFAALHVDDPADGIVEVQVTGRPMLVGRKGDYAAIALAADRDALERLLAATTNLADDTSLATWVDANQLSLVVTSRGIQQLVPKLTAGIRAAQSQIRQLQGERGQSAAAALNFYTVVLTAAESEVAQFGIGVRVDSAKNVVVVKRAQFTPDGTWAKWAADAKPATGNLLAGLPDGPFVVAAGVVLPPGALDSLMKLSVQMMQNQPMYKLTAAQAQKYVELSAKSMRGVQSMRMLLGVTKPGGGIYGNMSAVMTVDDSGQFLKNYEQMLAETHQFAEEAKSPAIPVMTSSHVTVGDIEVLKVSMDLHNMPQLAAPGGPDPQKMMQVLNGGKDTLDIYVAPADEHTVVMAYASTENLQTALDVCKSTQPGLSSDAQLTKVAAALPPGRRAWHT